MISVSSHDSAQDLPPQAGSRCALALRRHALRWEPRATGRVVDIFHLGTSSMWVKQINTYKVVPHS